ncbi:MAG: sigma-70 family RNA polymerase sigma factor [Huintestinicola sp.]|uniref:sigma-70 family RNA polymerase sigma factor n=1 Tax=Huintestinicola sp. TaxID=2981661 RepID=UPI003F09FD57
MYAENTAEIKTDISELFDRYKQTPDKALRNEIVMRSMHIVRYAVLSTRNMYRRYADDDDISNEAVLALMNAVDSFDPKKNVKFDTYASIKVRGAIIDYIRRQDSVPRGVRKFIRDYDSVYSVLYTELDREPTREEIAARLGITTEKLDSFLSRSAAASTLSFEELLFDGFDMADDTGESEAEAQLILSERRSQLVQAIDSLKDKERTVITLYYYEKLKYSEIAKVLGISESRVCQIHTKAVDKLREKISGYMMD